MDEPSLKILTARSIKWNAIDRLSSQILYALTGVVLANILSPSDFGLVGAILIFQAFASLLVDSGFSYALIQRKRPSELDYSSVLWFNLGMAVVIYAALWLSAPLIAACFEHDTRLIGLSRVMFLTFILNASSIVQVNRLTKQMNVRPIAVANAISLAVGGVIGIALAYCGYGAWALVWQSIANTGLKSAILWVSTRWVPMTRFSWASIKSFFSVGGSMMASSLLNTVFLNIYSFVVGNRAGMASLGYYTQSDKWSKMGIMSVLQTLTSSFLPALSAVQDEPQRFRRLCSKMNRMTSYILFPVMIGLVVMAAPIFHTLFSDKWDASIALFQLLVVRGIFTVLAGVYNQYILALGRSRMIVRLEMIRDGVALVALILTLPYVAMQSDGDVVWGIRVMLYGQIIASVIGWGATLVAAVKVTGADFISYLTDMAPYLALSLVIGIVLWPMLAMDLPAIVILGAQALAGTSLYLLANHLLHSRIQTDVIAYVCGRLKK